MSNRIIMYILLQSTSSIVGLKVNLNFTFVILAIVTVSYGTDSK